MLWFIIGILCVAVDRLSKMYIANNFMTGQSVPVINRVFHITYHLNDGAAFSVLSGKTVFLTVISLVIMAAIAAYIIIKKPKNNLLLLSLTFILSGAAGNFIDRVASGAVVDFLDFRLINFPVFNIADCFVVIGGALLFLYILKYSDNDDKRDDKKNEGEMSDGKKDV